jgi:hypothetical protein
MHHGEELLQVLEACWSKFLSMKFCSWSSGGNPGLKRTRIGATFKKRVVKNTFKIKINIKRHPLNFKSIQ